jgi:HEAT repeat protein
MEDLPRLVRHYAGELAGSRADDAFHSLLELGPAALLHVAEAFRLSRDPTVKSRLAQVISESRAFEALPLLVELLQDHDAEIWKTALDGLVTLGEDPAARPRALEILDSARKSADPKKQEWIEEALSQISATNDSPGPRMHNED